MVYKKIRFTNNKYNLFLYVMLYMVMLSFYFSAYPLFAELTFVFNFSYNVQCSLYDFEIRISFVHHCLGTHSERSDSIVRYDTKSDVSVWYFSKSARLSENSFPFRLQL